MKKIFFSLIILSVPVYSYSQDTLKHFNPFVDTPIIESYPSDEGYYTGHNVYGDEEFGEKYELSGSGTLLGMAVIHEGENGTSQLNASYKAYGVATNGLPGGQLANKIIPYNNVLVDGSLSVVLFDTPVSVSGDFFVSLNLGDYLHDDPGTKRIALTHSTNGTRPASDFNVYGRNVVRWHSHDGDADWKDYRTEIFQSYQPAVYFSLFPIIELGSVSVINIDQTVSVASAYPNPSSGCFVIPISSNGGRASFQLFDLSGKLVSETQRELSTGKNNYEYSTGDVERGEYILLINIPNGSVAQRVIIQ